MGCEAEYRIKRSTEVKNGDKLSMRDNFGAVGYFMDEDKVT